MAASDMLLQLIADLQRGVTVARGRRMLLEYAKNSSGARLALLFVLDKERQRLVLLERCGRRVLPQAHYPRQANPASAGSSSAASTSKPHDTKHIPLHGLFGSALSAQSSLYIPHAFTDARTLEEEQYWIGRVGEHVMLSAIGSQQGVLVLCFDPETKSSSPQTHDRKQAALQAAIEGGGLLVCTTLLSAYLSGKERASAGHRTANGRKVRANRQTKLGAAHPGNDQAAHPGGDQAPIARTLQPTGTPRPVGASLLVTPRPADTMQQLSELYEIKLKAAIDQERNRIAHDIHDGAAQRIAHALHKLEFIQRIFEKQPELALFELDRTATVLKESLNDLRHGISSLIPAHLEEQGFMTALQSLLDEHMQDEPGLHIAYEGDDLSLLPLSLEVSIFRFIQEALNNVRKHAQASSVHIRTRMLANMLLVEVSDNGKGFDVGQLLENRSLGASYSMGLRTMRERVQQAGGNWELQSNRGEGTTVKARFPLEHTAAALTNREREVLQLLVEGLTNRAIAEKLSVSTETIKSHVHHIMQKMQVNDRTLVAVRATRQRWL